MTNEQALEGLRNNMRDIRRAIGKLNNHLNDLENLVRVFSIRLTATPTTVSTDPKGEQQ